MPVEIRPVPIRKTLVVPASVEKAFDTFVGRMHEWSPAVQSLIGARRDIVIEPHAGGRWYEVSGEDGAQADWGRVLVWERPHRVVLAWQLGADFTYDPSLVTEVGARFTAEGERSTRVDFEHRDLERFGERAEATKISLDGEGGWTGSFALYVALLQRES